MWKGFYIINKIYHILTVQVLNISFIGNAGYCFF